MQRLYDNDDPMDVIRHNREFDERNCSCATESFRYNWFKLVDDRPQCAGFSF